MNKIKKIVCCPMCKGKGKITQYQPNIKYTLRQRNIARKLYSQGYSLRKIGVKLGIGPSAQKVKSMMMSKIV